VKLARAVWVWYGIEYAVAWSLLRLVCWLPPRVAEWLASIGARAVFFLWRSRRRIAIENLLGSGVCADSASARRLGFEAFRAFTLMVIESMLLRDRLTAETWGSHMTLHLSAEAERLLRVPGQGLLVASAHIGNWEIAARAVSLIKPMCVVYRPMNNPLLERLLHAARSGEQLRLLSRLESHPLRFMRALAAGEIVALMIDQHTSEGRVRVNFLGRPAWTPRSVAMLHLATRVPVLTAFALRTGRLRYEVHAVGPARVELSGDRDRDAQALTQALADEVERVVRAHPEQYMWGHRRWKD
jgi:KDO2-lipid IV(A) lauroyltransferase